ncbi:TIGR03905 family TSCPD domain-containing protein [bacterium]|nr:TIGR03905 family TSCPD domain-containing protein [bacterium]
MRIRFYPQGVCCQQMEVEIENDIIIEARFYGGCNGNLKGIASLIKGMNIYDVINKVQGTRCGDKSTSCPDQLSICLKEYLKLEEQKQVL